MLITASFYLFATIVVLSALAVVFARNTVHAALFLILSFFNAGAIMIILGTEFIALMVAVVYVGAIAVLFLFVVMMLEIRKDKIAALNIERDLPFAGGVAAVIFVEILLTIFLWGSPAALESSEVAPATSGVSNIQAIGQVLYTDHVIAFQVVGLILLVAMIGAIVLVMRQRPGVRRQNIRAQLNVTRKDAVMRVKPEIGQGVDL